MKKNKVALCFWTFVLYIGGLLYADSLCDMKDDREKEIPLFFYEAMKGSSFTSKESVLNPFSVFVKKEGEGGKEYDRKEMISVFQRFLQGEKKEIEQYQSYLQYLSLFSKQEKGRFSKDAYHYLVLALQVERQWSRNMQQVLEKIEKLGFLEENFDLIDGKAVWKENKKISFLLNHDQTLLKKKLQCYSLQELDGFLEAFSYLSTIWTNHRWCGKNAMKEYNCINFPLFHLLRDPKKQKETVELILGELDRKIDPKTGVVRDLVREGLKENSLTEVWQSESFKKCAQRVTIFKESLKWLNPGPEWWGNFIQGMSSQKKFEGLLHRVFQAWQVSIQLMEHPGEEFKKQGKNLFQKYLAELKGDNKKKDQAEIAFFQQKSNSKASSQKEFQRVLKKVMEEWVLFLRKGSSTEEWFQKVDDNIMQSLSSFLAAYDNECWSGSSRFKTPSDKFLYVIGKALRISKELVQGKDRKTVSNKEGVDRVIDPLEFDGIPREKLEEDSNKLLDLLTKTWSESEKETLEKSLQGLDVGEKYKLLMKRTLQGLLRSGPVSQEK